MNAVLSKFGISIADTAARSAVKKLFDMQLLSVDDRVILTSGDSMEQRGATNTLRLLVVGAEGKAEGLGDL